MTTSKKPSSADALQTVLYQYITLYDRFVEQQQAQAEATAELAQQVRLLAELVARLLAISPTLHQQLKATVEALANRIQPTLEQALSGFTSSQVDAAIDRLAVFVQTLEAHFHREHQQVKQRYWATGLLSLVVAVIASTVSVQYVLSHADLALTVRERRLYEDGLDFNYAMEALTPAERQQVVKRLNKPVKKRSD